MAGNRHDSGQGADPRLGPSCPATGKEGRWSAPDGQPEYVTAPQDQYRADTHPDQAAYAPDPYTADPYPAAPNAADPYAADRPGNTRSFTIGGEQYYGDDGYQQGVGYEQGFGGQDNVTVYRAGGQSAPHVSGPRPHWRELLTGIYRSPSRTFDRMRQHQCWLPALSISLIYGALAALGLGSTHGEIVNSTFATAAWDIAGVAVAFALAGAMLGAVTYALARQLGGDGPWQSTVGLAVLISWTTDAPRLLFALFLPSGSALVQGLGWATWLLCAGLLTTMVRRVHDLPWGKAAGAAAVQLLVLLVLIKLPTLG